MEVLKNKSEKLKSIVAVGLATMALAGCDQPVQAKGSPAPQFETTSDTPVPAFVPIRQFESKIAKMRLMPDTLRADWEKTLAAHKGAVDIAVYDNTTGQTVEYSNTSTTYNTASIIKLSILEEVLIQDQAAGHSLTESERASAEPMIEVSDNDAASTLWNHVGGVPVMNGFYAQNGETSTHTDGSWGLTQTTALDQLHVVNNVAYPSALITPDSAAVANDLLDHVVPYQRWGIGAGLPSNVGFELKNGWLPYQGDWSVNSIGHVHGEGEDYTIAVLTDGTASMQDGVDIIEDLAKVTWNDIHATNS